MRRKSAQTAPREPIRVVTQEHALKSRDKTHRKRAKSPHMRTNPPPPPPCRPAAAHTLALHTSAHGHGETRWVGVCPSPQHYPDES